MSNPGILENPVEFDSSSGSGDHWIVTVFDNPKNTWDQVMNILIEATGCTFDEAHIETWEIDRLGKSVVHHGDQEECEQAARIIARIGIRVEVSSE